MCKAYDVQYLRCMIENKLRFIYLKCVLSLAIMFIIHAAKASGKSVKPTLQSALPNTKLNINPCCLLQIRFNYILCIRAANDMRLILI